MFLGIRKESVLKIVFKVEVFLNFGLLFGFKCLWVN